MINDTVGEMELESLVGHPALERTSRFIHRDRLLVLAYHGVEDRLRFRDQVKWLLKTREPISIEDLHRSVSTGEPLPSRSFLVTFDDGRRSVLTNGLDVLGEFSVPAVLFVVAGLIGTTLPFWWDEVEQLSLHGGTTAVSDLRGVQLVRYLKTVKDGDRNRAIDELRDSASRAAVAYPHLTVDEIRLLDRSGIAIGNHSLTHPLLDQCDGETMFEELVESRRLLESWLDRPVTSLAYPNGNVDSQVVDAARRSGHGVAFMFDHRLQRLFLSEPLKISRVRVDATASLDRFKGLASGLLPAIHHLRGRP